MINLQGKFYFKVNHLFRACYMQYIRLHTLWDLKLNNKEHDHMKLTV